MPTNPIPPANKQVGLADTVDTNADYKAYFLGWYYKDKNVVKKWNFESDQVTKALQLYPKWKETKHQPRGVARPGNFKQDDSYNFENNYDPNSLYGLLYDQNKKCKTGYDRIDPREIDTSEITNIKALFFNEIKKPQTDLVINLISQYLKGFDEEIAGWDTSKVTDMSFMFLNDGSFEQPIGGWNVGKVENMKWMFKNAKSNQNWGSWSWKPSCNLTKEKTERMFSAFSESSSKPHYSKFYDEIQKLQNLSDKLKPETGLCTPASP